MRAASYERPHVASFFRSFSLDFLIMCTALFVLVSSLPSHPCSGDLPQIKIVSRKGWAENIFFSNPLRHVVQQGDNADNCMPMHDVQLNYYNDDRKRRINLTHCVHLLRCLFFQARALVPQHAETDVIRFIVGTQSLKFENQVSSILMCHILNCIIILCSLKNLQVLIYSKLHENDHVITCQQSP